MSTTRRDFFAFVAETLGLSFAVIAAEERLPSVCLSGDSFSEIQRKFAGFSDGHSMTYKGWRIWWTGLKVGFDHDYLMGQWVAYPPKPEGIAMFVNVPNGVRSVFAPVGHFDCGWKEGRPVITPLSTAALVESAINEGLMSLREMIDAVGPPAEQTCSEILELLRQKGLT